MLNGKLPKQLGSSVLSKAINGFHRLDAGDFFQFYDDIGLSLQLSSFAEGSYRFTSNNVITANGGRLYIDSGDHMEVTTPEVRTARQVVLYELAAEQIAVNAFRAMVDFGVADAFRMNKRNFDRVGNSWGAHENLHVSTVLENEEYHYRQLFAAHNVTRAIYTGSGGVLQSAQNRFVTSPRLYLCGELTNSAPYASLKPIVFYGLKDLDDDRGRYHNVSGDANSSPFAILAKHAMNSVVARLIEAGIDMSEIYLDDPLEAAYQVSTVANLKQKTPIILLSNGEMASASMIQRYICETALSHADQIGLTKEEIAVTLEVQRVCEQIERDIDDVSDCVEWVARLRYLQRTFDTEDLLAVDQSGDLFAADMHWDRIDGGKAAAIRTKGWGWRGFDRAFGRHDIDRAKTTPPMDTRANKRISVLSQGVMLARATIGFLEVRHGDLKTEIKMFDPLDSTPVGQLSTHDIE